MEYQSLPISLYFVVADTDAEIVYAEETDAGNAETDAKKEKKKTLFESHWLFGKSSYKSYYSRVFSELASKGTCDLPMVYPEEDQLDDWYPFRYKIYYHKSRDLPILDRSYEPIIKMEDYESNDMVDVTFLFLKHFRKQWIYNMVQENEFNIFRSLCFTVILQNLCCGIDCERLMNPFSSSGDEEKQTKLTFCYLLTLLQLLLTTSLLYDLCINFEFEFSAFESVEGELIVATSVVAVSFISILTVKSMQSWRDFYLRISIVCQVPWIIVGLDFISNVFVATCVASMSFFVTLNSNSLTEAVLNSFALLFIMDLDDLCAMLFANDADHAVAQDLKYAKHDVEQLRRKRKILVHSEGAYCREFIRPFTSVLFAPLKLLKVLWIFANSLYILLVERPYRDDLSVAPAQDAGCVIM